MHSQQLEVLSETLRECKSTQFLNLLYTNSDIVKTHRTVPLLVMIINKRIKMYLFSEKYLNFI